MSSDPRRLAPLLAAALVAATLAGCGNKGAPAPPLRFVPARTQDLAARQQGGQILLEFTYPKTTPSGMVLDGITGVEVWEAARPMPPGTKPEPLDPRAFAAAATQRLDLAGEDVASVVQGDRLRLSLPLPENPSPEARYLAVRTRSESGERSEFSNLATVLVVVPPSPPEGVNVTPKAEGVEVTWLPPSASTVVGYNVYRREATVRNVGAPLAALDADKRSHLDTTARFGTSYIYAVTSVAQREPLVESAIQASQEVRYQDRFPPPAPTDLVALTEATRVRLVWGASEAPDLAGYLVYRRGPEGAFRRLNAQSLARPEYVDQEVPPGDYTYRVTAVDQQGNESESGPEVAATVQGR